MPDRNIIDDIFNIPTDGSNLSSLDDFSEESQEGSYASVIGSSDESTFEDKAKHINNKISEIDMHHPESAVDRVEKNSEDKNDSESNINTDANADTEDEEIEEKETKSDEFESILSDAKTSIKSGSSSPPDVKMVSEQSVEFLSAGEESDESDSEISSEEQVMDDSQDLHQHIRDAGFNIDAPSSMFKQFYSKKIEVLEDYLSNGRLPFNQYMNEMRSCSVNINVVLTDMDALSEKMQQIQQYRNRVIEIKSKINPQYYLWKRLVPLMHGQLARVVYEKPAAKQDGVNHEHMGDMEMYFNELEGLFETSKDVLNNLDAAYDNLSRQVTLAMPQQKSDKKMKGNFYSDEIDNNHEMSDFDSLSDHDAKKVVKSNAKKTNATKIDPSGPSEIDFF